MNKINDVISEYKRGEEVEVIFKLKKNTNSIELYNLLNKKYGELVVNTEIHKFVTFSFKNNIRIRKYRHKKDISGKLLPSPDEIITKRKLKDSILSNMEKIKRSEETPITVDLDALEKPQHVRFAQRISMTIGMFWLIDITNVISREGTHDDLEILKSGGLPPDPNKPEDVINELELEYIGTTQPNAEKINKEINKIREVLYSMNIKHDIEFLDKLKYVYAIYKNLDPRSYHLNRIDTKSINPVVTLKPHKWRELMGDPSNIYITDKIDGVRKIIYSDSNFIYILNNSRDFITINYPTNFEFIVDAEEYVDPKDNKICYYFFDIYKYRKTRYHNKTFTEKLVGMNQVYEELVDLNKNSDRKMPIRINKKGFVKLNGNYKETLNKFTTEEKPYLTDGFIIINDKTNTSYKYKQENTIDFYIRRVPNIESDVYILYCTISEKYFKIMGLSKSLLDDVPKEFSGQESFPIPFVSSLDTSVEVSTWTPSESERELDYEGLIGEFRRENDTWKLLKIRKDRTVSEKYYGNNYMVAESNFGMDLIDFKITNMGGYFNTSNKKAQENVRRYTNLVMKKKLFDAIYATEKDEEDASPLPELEKRVETTDKDVLEFIKSISEKKFVKKESVARKPFVIDSKKNFKLLDVSCGHGQDLGRYGDVEYVLGIDKDKNAIIEMIDRRLESKGGDSLLLTAIADVTKPASETFEMLKKKHNISEGNFTHCVCLLAFHYFCDNATTMNNALSFISRSLKKGGKFGMILYDGRAIINLMGNANRTTEFPFGPEMCLKKDYNEYTLFGTKIKVKLPFSGNEFYSENVVDINGHLETFQSHNLYLDKILKFSDYFDSPIYKVKNKDDRDYLSLYHCLIFVKK